MNLKQLLLSPAARVAGMNARRQLNQFTRACIHGRQAQDALLAELTAYGADSQFGRVHQLDRVRSYEDFTKAVPIGSYSSLAPYMRRVYEGDTTAMFAPGVKVLLFALTSGTTGEPKRIPITPEALARYRMGWNVFGFKAFDDHPEAWLRPILQVSSPAVETHSPTGVPCGSISGLLAANQKRIVRRMYVAGPDVMAIDDPIAKYYTIMRIAMPRDVAILSTANPSTIVKLMSVARNHLDTLLRDLRDGTLTSPGPLPAGLTDNLRLRKQPRLVRKIEKGLGRDGELLFSHFWNMSLLMHWTGGTLGLYLPQVRRLMGNAPIRDIGLLASEGRFSLPLIDGTAAGPADVLGSFLEFIPADEIDSVNPNVLRSHELETDQEYFLLFSNFSGLWRYNIYDRIRVTGHMGQTPIIAFLAKGHHTTSLTGEKLTEHQVVAAMSRVCHRLETPVDQFLIQPCFANPPFYRLTIEADEPQADQIAAELDTALGELNIEYASKRHTGRLGSVKAEPVEPGMFDKRETELLAARNGRSEQYKHQYLLTEVAVEATTAAAR